MAILKRKQNRQSDVSEQALFRRYSPMVLAIMDEINPLLEPKVDPREVLAMASMYLGRLLRQRHDITRQELRKSVEKYLVDTFAIEMHPQTGSEGSQGDADRGDDLRGSRILVVDDSAMARRQIQFFLNRDGFEVFEAKSGEEALWLVNEVDPDLVLMDIVMEEMDGMETCRRIKEDPRNATLPVIFLSARGERKEIVRGFNCGAIDYIVKPFHPAESLTRIRTHLRVKRLAQIREKHIAELNALNEEKDRVMRMASHDLRNPVAAIAGLAGFLKEDTSNLSPEQREIVDCIEDAGQSVVTLLNELLDVSAINRGKGTLCGDTVSLPCLLRNLSQLFKGEAARKQIGLTVEVEEALPEITGDRQKLRQVVDNLISNALKFTPLGGRVRIGCRSLPGDRVILEFEDNGPGIPEGEKDRLFKEFGKTSNRPSGGEKSTGLGLSICKGIVETHKGTIQFENLPEGGVCFSVILPVK
ncbi:MAG: hybrid sensor histidine kinase/response regulator [Oceanipulchritudo sp.]